MRNRQTELKGGFITHCPFLNAPPKLPAFDGASYLPGRARVNTGPHYYGPFITSLTLGAFVLERHRDVKHCKRRREQSELGYDEELKLESHSKRVLRSTEAMLRTALSHSAQNTFYENNHVKRVTTVFRKLILVTGGSLRI